MWRWSICRWCCCVDIKNKNNVDNDNSFNEDDNFNKILINWSFLKTRSNSNDSQSSLLNFAQ